MPSSVNQAADLLSADLNADPHGYFRALRADDPVHWNDRHKAWLVTRHADVVALFRDPRLTSNRIAPYRDRRLSEAEQSEFGRTFRILESWMVFQDEPDHKRLRSIVQKAFTPRTIDRLTDAIEHEVAQALDAVLPKIEAGDTVDLLNDFAYDIPAAVIAKMLGVPQEDRGNFVTWSDDLVDVISGGVGEPERNRNAHRAVVALEEYLDGLIARSQDDEADNLLTALVEAEEEGERLSRLEVIATAILLLFAGHRTTACLICNGMLSLIRHPDQAERLRSEPELVAPAVEEVLRYEGHTKLSVRIAGESFEYHGRQISRGERVFLVQLSANRDDEVFEDPDRFDVGRSMPASHVGFGMGIHYCLGAPLARKEGQITLGRMMERLPPLVLAADAPRWAPTLISRTQTSLPVRRA